jgi:hypothetical protein
MKKILDETLANYDFGKDVTVNDVGNWEQDGENHYINLLRAEICIDEAFIDDRISFHVLLDEKDEVLESYGYFVSNGMEVV